ncbi:MAG: amidase [Deltaproteobacteria bacterium]|nr:amidase [Deltaproteobacteria bacterium]
MSLPLPEYERFDALGLAELVRTKQVSPSELVEAAIARIEARDKHLNAVIHRQFDKARAAARAAAPSPDQPFAGVPFLLKDIMGHEAGEPTTYGSRAFVGTRSDRDAELTIRYKRAGLIVLGKTNVPELGIYGVTESELYGPCRNPWNLAHTPGGSSGGSAAAVAAGYVPAAHGGDGGGSIRIPAAHSGLVGMKPTRARNPAGPFAGERWAGFVSEHVLTRSVRDSAAMLDATQGPDAGAPYQVVAPEGPYLAEVARDPGKLRIAFSKAALFGDETHPDNVAAVEDAARLAASLGHEVEEAAPPFDRDTLVRAYFTVIAAGANLGVRNAGELKGRPARAAEFERTTWLLKLIGDKLTAGEYAAALHTIQVAHRTLAPFFTRYDVFLTPTAARPPAPIGAFKLKPSERRLVAALSAAPLRPLLLTALSKMAKNALGATPNTQLFNMTGQPAISLPLFWSSDGLPIGTQWVGRFADEATLYRLAGQLERARPWFERRPPPLPA